MHNFLVFTLLFMLFSCASNTSQEQEENQALNLRADTLYSDGDQEIGVYDFEGLEPLFNQKDDRIHIINFWATWCKPCVAELPYFNRLAKENPSYDMSFVSLDFSTNIESKVLPFLAENELNGRVMVLYEPDANAWIPKIDPDWSGSIPATLIYKGEREVFYEQSFTFEELEESVKPFK